jgi:hypothetical protein
MSLLDYQQAFAMPTPPVSNERFHLQGVIHRATGFARPVIGWLPARSFQHETFRCIGLVIPG